MSVGDKSEVDLDVFSISKFPSSPIANQHTKAERLSQSVFVKSPMMGASPWKSPNTAGKKALPSWNDFKSPSCQRADHDFPQLLLPKFEANFESTEFCRPPDISPMATSPKTISFVANALPAIYSNAEKRSFSLQTPSRMFFNPLKNSNNDSKRSVALQDTIVHRARSDFQICNFVKLKKLNQLSRLARSGFRSLASPNRHTKEGEVHDPTIFAQSKIKKQKMKRNLNAEGSKVAVNQRKKRNMSCSCKSTRCMKLYCECFRNKNQCGELCRCLDCKNKSKIIGKQKKTLEESSGKKAGNDISISQERSNIFPNPSAISDIQKDVGGEMQICMCQNPLSSHNRCVCNSLPKTFNLPQKDATAPFQKRGSDFRAKEMYQRR